MGAYLNKPITDKQTEEGGNTRIKYAATSMQGWRVNQEDAHNCLADLREGWSMFAVYDGHGGPEVAKYAAEKFPEFLLKREFWEQEDLVKALQDAFVDFDDHLRSGEVMKQLKVIAGKAKEKKGEEETDEDKAKMYEEGQIPLHELLARYGVQLVNGGGQVLASKLVEGISGEEDSDLDEEEDENEAEEKEGESEGSDDRKSAKRACASSPLQEEVKRQRTEVLEHENNDKQDDEKETEKESNLSEVKTDVKPVDFKENESKTDLICKADGDAPVMREKPVKVLGGKKKDTPTENGDSDDDDDDFEASGDIESEEDEEEDVEESDEDDDEMENAYGPGMESPGEDSGTTACVVLVTRKKIIVANVGDSRAVLCRNGKALELSFDHKPEDEVEIARIRKAGGRVTDDGRVNGGLNLSRAFGDHCYKKNTGLPLAEQMISALPDVISKDLTPEDSFLVVACDGIWNSLDSQQVVDFVKERLEKGEVIKNIVEALCTECLAENTAGDGTGCDNMTVIIADLTNATTE